MIRNYTGQNLKTIRERLGLRQEDIADKLNVSRASIGSYEEGRANVPVEVAIELCRQQNIRLEDFVTKPIE